METVYLLRNALNKYSTSDLSSYLIPKLSTAKVNLMFLNAWVHSPEVC